MKKTILRYAIFAAIFIGITPPMWAWDPLEHVITLSLADIHPNSGYPRGPIYIPQVGQIEHTLYFHDEADFTLCLYSVDENDNLSLEYTTFVPSTTESVQLPTDLQGTYVIEVVRGDLHFWGQIVL